MNRSGTLSVAAALFVAATSGLAQFREPPQAWLPPVMSNPTKLSPDRMVDDEDPAITRDRSGRVWVAWSSCRTKSEKLPASRTSLDEWQWPEDGQDVIVARWFDGRNWSQEQLVSASEGVNLRPAIAPSEDGACLFWTSRRSGVWAAYQRCWANGKWGAESKVPDSEGSLYIRARALSDGAVLAVTSRMAAPRLELDARILRQAQWTAPMRLDEGKGRCHRASLLDLPDSRWLVAWDEERGGNYDIFARFSDGAVERMTESPIWDTTPALARTPGGSIWLAWERKETAGGRYAYQGRSIFGKVFEGGRWSWAPSPFEGGEPGRLTRHSRFWATQGISEERYPQLVARSNGEMWLFWLGGGRMSSTSFSGRVLRQGRWSEPRLIFHDPVPYPAFALPSARAGDDLRSRGRGPYQTPLCNQMTLALDDGAGLLWMAYEVPKRRHITDTDLGDQNRPSGQIQARPAGYGADIYSHWVDLDEREYRLPRVTDDSNAVEPLRTRSYRDRKPHSIEIAGERYQLVFGDLHGHTENDAIGTVDMYYAHGLEVTGMDFLASTNHDYTPDFLTQSEWALTQALAGVYNAIPGRVAFSGYEWTTVPVDARGGHRAMYFLTDRAPLHRSTTAGSNTIGKLFALLRGVDVILQPHHLGWEGYNPKLQPVIEITSAWRERREEGSEMKREGKVRSVWEALDRGYRVGFVGSGDSHWLGPGEDYGITGAYVRQLSREGLFDAIRNRRVFASTGARTFLDFRVNGVFMGGAAKAGPRPVIEVSVTGDADLERIEIVRDHHVIHAVPGSSRSASFTFLDRSGNPDRRSASYYYLRIEQRDGMRTWSSPVWAEW
ncbi:MAG: hypothetical protein HY235_19940 [Acidobacteria bacterium]|nr:hypothetical protein [Acidobacteriota bacterium]